jgi:hypothetical protein
MTPISADEALTFYFPMLAGNEPTSSLVEIRPLERDGRPSSKRDFLPVRDVAGLKRLVQALAPDRNVFVGAAPRVRPEGKATAIERVWCLWADIDTGEALEAALAIEPAPPFVVRTGSGGGHLYWPLREPLSPAHAQRANRRLALALGGDMNATDPARILRPPGTLNHKHDPPRPVVCTRRVVQTFDARDVVGHLPDSPHYAPRSPQAPPDQTTPPERVLDGLARTVREAKEGNRNATLFWAVCRIAERVDAGELEERDALPVIHGAGLDAGLSDTEVRATIRSGLARRATAAA